MARGGEGKGMGKRKGGCGRVIAPLPGGGGEGKAEAEERAERAERSKRGLERA